MTQANNIVLFPTRHTKYNGPTTIEEVGESLDMLKQFHIQETIEAIVVLILMRKMKTLSSILQW